MPMSNICASSTCTPQIHINRHRTQSIHLRRSTELLFPCVSWAGVKCEGVALANAAIIYWSSHLTLTYSPAPTFLLPFWSPFPCWAHSVIDWVLCFGGADSTKALTVSSLEALLVLCGIDQMSTANFNWTVGFCGACFQPMPFFFVHFFQTLFSFASDSLHSSLRAWIIFLLLTTLKMHAFSFVPFSCSPNDHSFSFF